MCARCAEVVLGKEGAWRARGARSKARVCQMQGVSAPRVTVVRVVRAAAQPRGLEVDPEVDDAALDELLPLALQLALIRLVACRYVHHEVLATSSTAASDALAARAAAAGGGGGGTLCRERGGADAQIVGELAGQVGGEHVLCDALRHGVEHAISRAERCQHRRRHARPVRLGERIHR
jgi:hypothetical protein